MNEWYEVRSPMGQVLGAYPRPEEAEDRAASLARSASMFRATRTDGPWRVVRVKVLGTYHVHPAVTP